MGSQNDLVFVVKGRNVYAVRAIVKARSTYFAALTGWSNNAQSLKTDQERAEARQARFGDVGAGAPQKIEIQDASYEALRAIMIYIHSDIVKLPTRVSQERRGADLDPELAMECLELGAKYQLPRFQVDC